MGWFSPVEFWRLTSSNHIYLMASQPTTPFSWSLGPFSSLISEGEVGLNYWIPFIFGALLNKTRGLISDGTFIPQGVQDGAPGPY